MAPITTDQRRLDFGQDEARAEDSRIEGVTEQTSTVESPIEDLAAPGDTSGLTAEDLAVVAQIRKRSDQVSEVQRLEGTLPPQPKRLEISPDKVEAFVEGLGERMNRYAKFGRPLDD